MFALACVSYVANIAVGLAAQWGVIRIGRAHHWLYAWVFGLAAVSWWIEGGWGLGIVVLALALFPLARPRTPWHPALAALGAGGYVVAALGI